MTKPTKAIKWLEGKANKEESDYAVSILEYIKELEFQEEYLSDEIRLLELDIAELEDKSHN